jgi:hypothetical protein
MSCIKKERSCVSRFKFPKSTTTFYENYKKNLTKKSYKTQCEKNNQSENSIQTLIKTKIIKLRKQIMFLLSKTQPPC